MARSGSFRGGLSPFGGGTLDANAAFILPEPPAPTAPPPRRAPPPRGAPHQAPKPVIPGKKPLPAKHPPAHRPGLVRPPTRKLIKPTVKKLPVRATKPTAKAIAARRPPPPPAAYSRSRQRGTL